MYDSGHKFRKKIALKFIKLSLSLRLQRILNGCKVYETRFHINIDFQFGILFKHVSLVSGSSGFSLTARLFETAFALDNSIRICLSNTNE